VVDLTSHQAAHIFEIKKMAPEALLAGSPCQDLSGLNATWQSLHESKSGLFFEILRVVDLFAQWWPEVTRSIFVEMWQE